MSDNSRPEAKWIESESHDMENLYAKSGQIARFAPVGAVAVPKT